MIVTHEQAMTCSDSEACTNEILVKLKHGVGFVLQASTPTDVVHGSVTIAHGQPHQIRVEVYDVDEAPNLRHRSTLKRPDTMPTKEELVTRLKS